MVQNLQFRILKFPWICCSRNSKKSHLFKIQIRGGRNSPTFFDNETGPGVSTPGFQRVSCPGRNGKISHAEKYSLHLLTLSVCINQIKSVLYYDMLLILYHGFLDSISRWPCIVQSLFNERAGHEISISHLISLPIQDFQR